MYTLSTKQFSIIILDYLVSYLFFIFSPKDKSRSDTQREDSEGEKKPGSRVGSRPSTPVFVPLYDKDLIRTLAEVTFINGEVNRRTF